MHARVQLHSSQLFVIIHNRDYSMQTPQMDRKYGELVEASASAKSWGWASVSGRSSSRNGVHTKTDNSGGHVDGLDSSSRPFLWTAGSAQSGGGDKTFSPSFSYDRLVVDEPKEPTTPGFKVEKVKLFNSKTLKWVAAEQTDQASKDEAGHGDTVYPRIPQVFKDPAQTLADALLHAKTPDERRMILDQIANELRPGSFQASMVDFEASVGLVLTDDFHGPMVELIEAGSSAADSKKILRGDYIIEVNDTEVINRGADEVESMLIGKENTTVTVTLRVCLCPSSVSNTMFKHSI